MSCRVISVDGRMGFEVDGQFRHAITEEWKEGCT